MLLSQLTPSSYVILTVSINYFHRYNSTIPYTAIGDGMYDIYFNQIKAALKLRLLPPSQVFLVVVTDGLQNQGAYSPTDAVNAIKKDFVISKPTADTTLTFVAVGVNQVNEQTLLQIVDGDADKIHFVSDFDGSAEFAGKVLTSITEPCAKNVTGVLSLWRDNIVYK
jgi:von Willebrand factor type A domain